jgi:bifunctional DNase/RNase
MRVPIMVSEEVMVQAGIVPEEDISEEDAEMQRERPAADLEDENLDIFEEFLENFNIDDIGSQEDDEEDNE